MAKTNTAIFVVPRNTTVTIPNAIVLQPEDKTVITIEQIRAILGKLNLRQVNDQFILIRPAELMNEEAANALLKSLEEPGPRVHFALITDSPSRLLSTIRSRANLYFLRAAMDFTNITADTKIKSLAKRLMVARGANLVTLADEISKVKSAKRDHALTIIGTSIEMLYKTYLITGKSAYVHRLSKFLTAYDNIAHNGHIKLQIVANLS